MDANLTEFEHWFGLRCEEALAEVLGVSTLASAICSMKKQGILSLDDVARHPAEFDDALSVLFNPVGATFLEIRILKRFYRSIGLKFEWNDGRVFKEEVEEALRRFRGLSSHPSTLTEKGE